MDGNHKDDHLAVYPGDNLSDWVNYSAECEVKIVEVNGKEIGYLRYQWIDGLEVKEIIATKDNYNCMLNIVCQIAQEKNVEKIRLLMGIDKAKRLFDADDLLNIEDCYSVYDAFMIKSLTCNGIIDEYIDKVDKEEIRAGVISLTNVYDIEE